ncbi:hypothetical protein MKX01_000248 [Papaver californicum]|nr:hypothetical protein MKX01_000248 [Papaver californicum]
MEGGGKSSSAMKMMAVLLILGMFLGQATADFDFENCFQDCYAGCTKPDPENPEVRERCAKYCNLTCWSQGGSRLDSHRKTLAFFSRANPYVDVL